MVYGKSGTLSISFLAAVGTLTLVGLSTHADAQQATEALAHFAHVATGFGDAPGGRGLTVTTAIEVNAAMLHANLAAGRSPDLEAMKTHVRHVLHALAPASGDTGPGLGYGVGRGAADVAAHIEMAEKAPRASGTLQKLGPALATAARAVSKRAQSMTEIAAKILQAQTATEAVPFVEQLRRSALELDTGSDVNGNGRIDLDGVEPGMNQLEAQVYSILEGEKLPRILK